VHPDAPLTSRTNVKTLTSRTAVGAVGKHGRHGQERLAQFGGLTGRAAGRRRNPSPPFQGAPGQ
jgi:hypothetical protein